MKKVAVTTVLVLSLVLTACGSTVVSKAASTSVSSSSVAAVSISVIEDTSEAAAATTEATVEKREDTDFRNVCWGDSPDDVKKYETKGIDEGEDDEGNLVYDDSLNGHDVYVEYLFKNDKLVQAGYSLNEKLTTGGQYISILDSWKKSLVNKYGEPNSDNNGIDGIFYTVDKDQANSVDAGQALEFGYTGYIYTWKFDRTIIKLVAISKNFDVTVTIIYNDINYDASTEDASDF